jgi:chemotaxis protein methyltransferase CheR
MTREDYEEFRAFLADACGITLGDNKQYLVSSRLSPLMLEFNIVSIRELVERVRRDRHSTLTERIIDAMTTNETQWFRDQFPFEILKQTILAGIPRNLAQPVRIWSAACSSGQEPYSIAISVHEYLLKNPGTLPAGVQILATDISPTVLKQAALGVYDGVAIARGLSGERRQRYFLPEGSQWVVKPDVRRLVSFRELNLCQGYEVLGKFDVIFCRNVLIYFAPQLKRDIIMRMSQALNPGGYLFLGAAESISNYSDAFEMLRLDGGIAYRLKSRNAAPRRTP